MNCAEVNLYIDELLDRELAPELAELVEEHLSLCEPCQSAFEQQQSLQALLGIAVTHRPSPALDERVMNSFLQHHRAGQASASEPRGWREVFLGSVSFSKPVLAFACAVVMVALALAFNLGRMTGSEQVPALRSDAAPAQATPTVVEVPVERIVYVKTLRNPSRRSSQTQRPSSVAEAPADSAEPGPVPTKIASLEDFEPIKGATARVIKGSKSQ